MARCRQPAFVYPAAVLTRLWRLLLLNQFHDVLPGSCIAAAFDDAQRHYEDIAETAVELRHAALEAWAPAAEGELQLGWDRMCVLYQGGEEGPTDDCECKRELRHATAALG